MVRRNRLDLAAMARLSAAAEHTTAFALRAVCELGVADHLSTPRTLEELAELCRAHPQSLLRALRVLVRREVLSEPHPCLFALTELGLLLRSDHPSSLAAALRESVHIEALAELAKRVRGDAAPASPRLYQASGALEPVLWSFDAALVWQTREFARAELVADLGPSDGHFIARSLVGRRELCGVVLSSRARLERVQRDVEELDVAARCRLLPGELAAGSIPGEADCYLLRRVLTRLDDSAARTVLQSVRRALSAGSRLLLCEAPLGAGVLALQSEQYELALGRGRVRDVSELSALCADSGLGIERVERDAELVLFVLRAS